METIKGNVTHIVFKNDETGFKVLKIKMPKGPSVSVTGEFGPDIIKGTVATFHGDFKAHPKYGSSFRTSSYTITHNQEQIESLQIFLDQSIFNIGAERAHSIITYFGEDVIKVLDDEPHRLLEVDGIGEVSARSIQDAWKKKRQEWFDNREQYDLRAFLNNLGIKERRVKKIMTHFGRIGAEGAIRSNPYVLTEIEGFGFSTADFIARKLGIPESDPMRLKAYIHYLLKILCPGNGHLFLTVEDIVSEINKYCEEAPTTFIGKNILSNEDVLDPIKVLKSEKFIEEDNGAVYAKQCYLYETESVNRLIRIMDQPSDLMFLKLEDVEEHILNHEHDNNITLSDEQRMALYQFAKEKVSIITGLPGSGKTTIIRAIVSLIKKQHLRLVCMTPTGISAKKMAETTGHDAYTIHRILGFRGNEWTYNEGNKFDTDVIIIDEACLPYKQFVNLADGTKRYIGTIVNQRQSIEVLSYNTLTQTIEPKKIVNWFKYPYKNELYEIKVSRAKNRERQRTIRCTGNHKIFTPEGKTCASDLIVGDRVLVKGKFLNDFQKSFLMGSVLGDAYISKTPSGKNVKFVHGQNQKEYIEFKSELFHCRGIKKTVGGYKPEKYLWACNTTAIDDLDEIHDYIYPKSKGSKKTVSLKWLNQIDEIGLAAWYMDDGSLSIQKQTGYMKKHKRIVNPSYAAHFHTEGFDKEGCELISKWFKDRWGINSSVYKNGKRGHFFIRVTCESSKLLWDMIVKWALPSMKYKFPPAYNPSFKIVAEPFIEVKPYPIQEIRRYEPKDKFRRYIYDISVEGNNNYFSNNALVSNSMVDQEVFYRLLSAIKDRVHLIIVGDHNQLPSVGAGNVLRELLNCAVIPTVRLEKIFRQDEASAIIKVAHQIKDGNPSLELFKDDPKGDVFFYRENSVEKIEKFIVRLCQKFKEEKKVTFQILSPRNQGPLSVESLNATLQEVLNPAKEGLSELKCFGFILRKGDRIKVKKNDYENGIYNGDIGKVSHIGGGFVTIIVDDRPIKLSVDEVNEKIKLAYAMSVHSCLPGNTYINTDRGLKHIKDIKVGDIVHTTGGRFKKVLLHSNNGPFKKVIISTENNYRVVSSNEHKFLARQEDGEVFEKVKDLKIGDTLCLNRTPIKSPIDTPIQSDYFKGFGQRDRTCISLPPFLDKKISWLLGALIGDGSYRDLKDGTVEFSKPSSPEMLEEFVNIMRDMNLNPRPHMKGDKEHSYYVCSKNFREWLESLGYKYVTGEKKVIPPIIFETSIENRFAFLSGLIDTDGSVGLSGLVRFITTSKELTEQLQLLLLSCGITSSVYTGRIKDKSRKATYYVALNKKGVFDHKHLLDLKNLKKRDRLSKFNKCHVTFDRKIPYSDKIIQDFLDLFDPSKTRGKKGQGLCSVATKKLYCIINRIKHGKNALNFSTLSAMNLLLSNRGIKIPGSISTVLKSDFYYDKIKSIEYTDELEDMYDLEVEEDHLYNAQGFVCHNSQGQEYPYILLPFINQHGKMLLQRNLLYTAVTRAKQKVIIMGHGSAIEKAINNSSVYRRNTKLGERIIECFQQPKKSFLPELHGVQQNFQNAVISKAPLSSETIESAVSDTIDESCPF